MYIDTHSHLFSPEFDTDVDIVIDSALERGVGKIIMPAICAESYDAMDSLAARYPDILYPTMGLHPTEEGSMEDVLTRFEQKKSRYVAVGECGLDLYWNPETIERQKEILRSHFELSQRFDLPLILHTRDAFAPMKELLSEYKGLRGVMHGFAGTCQDYHEILELGDFLFGIGGVVTFKNSSLPEVVEAMSLDHIVLETDSPYLSPVPYRGKRNDSSRIPLIAAKIAEIKGVSMKEVEETTTRNALRMFNIS